MAVQSIKNQYHGINAHLHSLWQAEGGWNGFHTLHIGDLAKALQIDLLPMGYSVEIETSMQVRRYDLPSGRPEPDITILDPDARRGHLPSVPRLSGARVLTRPAPELFGIAEESDQEYAAIHIYRTRAVRSGQGEPVSVIELLSPSNKPGGSDAARYHDKRIKLTDSGIVLVEIDYLHEQPPTFGSIPAYRAGGVGAHPYRIVVVDPRPTFRDGLSYDYEFDVDAPIPAVALPLSGAEHLVFDFGLPYRQSFEGMFYGLKPGLVDYRVLPVNFDRYSESDQARIANRMLATLAAARDGHDLETGPFPTPDLPLDEALRQIEVLVKSRQ